MGKGVYNRRDFLTTIRGKQSDQDVQTTDGLFKKYARKGSGHRYYDTQEVDYLTLQESRNEDNQERVGNITSGLTPYTGSWGLQEVLHLLRRVSYGWKKAHIDQLLGMNVNSAVDFLTTFTNLPSDTPVNNYQLQSADENQLQMGMDWTEDFFSTTTIGQTTDNNRLASLRRWLFGNAVNADNNMREKMMLFLYHFVPIDFNDVRNSGFSFAGNNSARICYRYMKNLYTYSNGNFKDFIIAMSNEPAMMYYLNNHANTKNAPDENFARELLELFTLGKGPASQYTQDDVVEASKVLTGWRVSGMDTANVATVFQPNQHHTANKQFSSFFGNTTIHYQAGPAGANEFEELINMIFTKETIIAEYICRRLYRFFVYYDIDANIENNVIAPLAQQFIANNWELIPTVKTLLKSEHFFDVANRGVYIKSPFDLVAGMINQFSIDIESPLIDGQYYLWGYMNDTRSSSMEQRMGTVPVVAGWNAYYQVPAFHQYWINSVTIQNRERFITEMFNGVTLTISPGVSKKVMIDVIEFAQLFPTSTASDPDLLTATCAEYLLPVALSPTLLQDIKMNTLLSGQTTNAYWTTAWNNYINNPSNNSFKNIVETRLKNLLVTITKLAEFQLM